MDEGKNELLYSVENDDGYEEPLISFESEKKNIGNTTKKLRIFSQFCMIIPPILLLLIISTIMLGLKLDGKLESWKIVFLPIWLGMSISIAFLLGRWVIFFLKIKLNDNLESTQILSFLSFSLISFSFFSIFVYYKQINTKLSWNVVFIGLHLYFGLLTFLLFFSIFKAKKILEKTVIFFSAISLCILFVTLLFINLRLENKLDSTWSVTLMPLWILCGMPILAPIFSCFFVKNFTLS